MSKDSGHPMLHAAIENAVRRVLTDAGDNGAAPAFTIYTQKQPEHGDFSCNAALLLTPRLRRPPREVAERLREALGNAEGLISRAEIAGPGFLNFFLQQEVVK